MKIVPVFMTTLLPLYISNASSNRAIWNEQNPNNSLIKPVCHIHSYHSCNKFFVFTTSPLRLALKWRTMSRLRRRPHWSPCLRPSPNSVSQSNSTDPLYCCRNATPGWRRRNFSRRNSRYRTLVSRTIALSKAITKFKNTIS